MPNASTVFAVFAVIAVFAVFAGLVAGVFVGNSVRSIIQSGRLCGLIRSPVGALETISENWRKVKKMQQHAPFPITSVLAREPPVSYPWPADRFGPIDCTYKEQRA